MTRLERTYRLKGWSSFVALCTVPVVVVGCKGTPTGVRVRVSGDPQVTSAIKMVRVKVFGSQSLPMPTEQADFPIGATASAPAFPFVYLAIANNPTDRIRIDFEAFTTSSAPAGASPFAFTRVVSGFTANTIVETSAWFWNDCRSGVPVCGSGEVCNVEGHCEPGGTGPVQDAGTPSDVLECVATSSQETCDGIDNNCNGMTDEGLPLITCGRGVCSNTVYACANGAPSVCTPRPGTREFCDGLDNDCDGMTDNSADFATDPARPVCLLDSDCGCVRTPSCRGAMGWTCP